MTVYLFCGPTRIPSQRLDSQWRVLPPAEQGDVYCAAAQDPDAIGIVDGRFQDVPAVWHKEILWAIGRGIPVYGAASMGALRAVELAPFGMRGVGWVFEAYRSGELEDDDEVTVAHGGPDSGFRPTSEAMVNIRRTLRLAVSRQIVGASTAAALAAMAKDLFYPSRAYPTVLGLAHAAGLPAAELHALQRWLPAHRVDQKALDATQLITVMRRDAAGWYPRKPASFTFQHTVFFERLRRSAGALPPPDTRDADDGAVTLEVLLDELRCDPGRYVEVRTRALARCLARRGVDRAAVDGALSEVSDRFRRARDLGPLERMRQWLLDNDLDERRYTALIREEAALEAALTNVSSQLDVYLRSQLRADGLYRGLVDRVRAKRALLDEHGLDEPAGQRTGPDRPQLLRWYFARHAKEQPEDIADYWRALDHPDELAFLRAVRREYWYVTLTAHTSGETSP